MNHSWKWSGIIFIVLLAFSSNSFSQITGAGIQPKYNLSRQLNLDQDQALEHAISVQDYIFTSGFDAFIDVALGDKWTFRGKAGYETKGFYGYLTYPYSYDKHKFNYVSTDLNVLRKWGNSEKVQVYNFLGVTAGYLVSRTGGRYPVWLPPQTYEIMDGYSRFNLGLLGGVGLSLSDVCWFELEYNQDVLAPLNHADLKVRNTVFSANIGVNVLKLIKKA